MANDNDSPNSVSFGSINRFLEGKGIHCKQTIGKGTFSSVRVAGYDKLKKDVALKIIDTRSSSDFIVRFLPREREVVQHLNHRNIIHVFEIIDKPPFVCFVQELAASGDLLHKIKKNEFIDEENAKFYFRQLIEALTYLQVKCIAHRDIKCENVFLDKFENVKLGDFGFARFLKHGEESHTFCGSRAYVAPELLRSRPYNGFTADIWSAGIVLYVMVTGFMPFDDRNVSKMIEKQMQHRIAFPRRRVLSVEVKELIHSIVHPDPRQRRTYPEIVKSAWLIDTPYQLHTDAAISTRTAVTSSPI